MPRFKSGLACPTCDAAGVESEIYSEAGGGMARMVCASNQDHNWNDQAVFMALAPRKLPVTVKVDTVQRDHVPLNLMVPRSVKEALEARFGEKLATSLTSVLSSCAEPEMMVLNATELQRIAERLGTKPKSSGELFGMIFQMGEEVKSSKNDYERLMRETNSKRGGVGLTVDLGEWMSKGVAKADDAGVSLEEYLSKYLRDSLENDWVN